MKIQIRISQYISALCITLVLTGIIGCVGGDSSKDLIQKINPKDKTYTLEDLKAIGFKKSKTYKVEGLEGATVAYWGFHNRKEFEVRFYESHEDAKTLGIPMAQERVGEDAKLKDEEAIWDEGLRDARECGADKGGTTKDNWDHHIGYCMNPKYNEFIVYGNFIVLCQGYDAEDSFSNCNDMLSKLELE